MTTWNGFRGAATRLDDIDLPRIGAMIGVGEDEIHALLDVESAGSGFDKQGRPKMLFEPHVFYRNLSGAKRTQAVNAGLAYQKWGTKPYPADSYPRLVQAMAIDETAALKAASWGLPQVLGENYGAADFASPQAMVRAFMESEASHLQAMISFLISNSLDDDLRAHRWEALARGYNGAGYAKNGYHTKLAAAYAKWARIPDTPWSPPAGSGEPDRPVIGRGMRGEDVKVWQSFLGITTDGIFGPKTEAATIAWQKARGLVGDGVVGPKTWGAALAMASS